MFLPYSSEIYPEHRPWMAYIMFPVMTAVSFGLGLEGDYLDIAPCILFSFFDISGLIFLVYVLLSLPVLWAFGRAVCSKIGNFTYFLMLCLCFGLFWVISVIMDNYETFWMLGFVIHFITGVYLGFYPLNEVSCFFFIPPFRTFSITGIWVLCVWIATDLIFSRVLGWMWALAFHPTLLTAGVLSAWILVATRRVRIYSDEKTLWQIFRKDTPGEACWQQSWSVRSRREKEVQQDQEESDRKAVEEACCRRAAAPQEPAAVQEDPQGPAVLCPCGRVVHLPPSAAGKGARCPECGHVFHSLH